MTLRLRPGFAPAALLLLAACSTPEQPAGTTLSDYEAVQRVVRGISPPVSPEISWGAAAELTRLRHLAR